MKIDNFQKFSMYCQKFVNRMKEENIPTNLQKAMLKAYIASYKSRNNYHITISKSHITELIS